MTFTPIKAESAGHDHGDHGHGHSHGDGSATRTRALFSGQAAETLSSRPGDGTLVASGDGTGDGTTTTAALAGPRRFDVSRSPKDLARDGKIKEVPQSQEGALEFPNLTDKSAPKISVELQDVTKPQEKPNFVIKKDGTVEMHGDPEALNTKDIKVVIEREPGQLGPTDAQKASSDELVQYLSARLKGQNEEIKRNGVEVADSNNVLSPEARQAAGARAPAENSGMSPETQQSVGNMNRYKGNGGGEAPISSTNDYFPPRDVPRQVNESDRQAAIKEAVAGLVNPDKAAPYETVRKSPQGDVRAGRYGFSGKQISNWLDSLGDPLDQATIDKLIKEGKLPKGFTVASVAKLKAMGDKMQKGEAPSKEEMGMLPKDMQEKMATDMVESYKGKVGDNPGDIAAAMLSGKPAGELTAEDMSSPQAAQLKDAGQRLYDIASARQNHEQDDKIQWTPEGKVSVGDGKWLDGAAGTAFNKAKELAARDGVKLELNSAGRTYEEQASLYRRRGTPGVSQTVARPGTSNHEHGNAVDIQNWRQAKPYLERVGFVHGDGRGPIANDLVHFKYVGGRNSNA